MITQDSFSPKLYLFLSTAMELLKADKGNVQLFDEKTQSLKIVAQIGFNDDFLRTFESVTTIHSGICGLALQSGKRVVVEDTSTHPAFAEVGSTAQRFGFSAVQSTPLFNEGGRLFGMISTHFSKPHKPTETELQLLDEYLERTTHLIVRNWLHSYQPKTQQDSSQVNS